MICTLNDYAKILGAYYAYELLPKPYADKIETQWTEFWGTDMTSLTPWTGTNFEKPAYGLGAWCSGDGQSINSYSYQGILPVVDRKNKYWALIWRNKANSGRAIVQAYYKYGLNDRILEVFHELAGQSNAFYNSQVCNTNCMPVLVCGDDSLNCYPSDKNLLTGWARGVLAMVNQ